MNFLPVSVAALLGLVCAIADQPLHAQAQSAESSAQKEFKDTLHSSSAAQIDCVESQCCDPALHQAACHLCPCFYFSVDGLVLFRNNSSANSIIVQQDINGNAVQNVLSANDLDFGAGGGVRVNFGKRISDCWSIDVAYLGLFDSNASATVIQSDPGTILTFPGPLGLASNVFFGPGRIHVNYDSALHGAEFNLVHCCCSCNCDDCYSCDSATRCESIEWLVGFRYLYLPERLQIFGEREEVGGIETGVYDVRTDNNLFGAQVGGKYRRCVGRWGWEGLGKVGIYGNDAQQRQSLVDFPDFYLRPPTGDERGQVAFVGELGLNLLYQISDVWNLRAGYNLFWIDGVALAPQQLDFSANIGAGDQLDSSGSVFLHGVNIGLEARW